KPAAWLHDILEDTPWTAQALREAGIPASTVDTVLVLRRRPGEPYTTFIARLADSGDAQALAIKNADLADNPRPGLPAGRETAARTARYRAALAELAARRPGHDLFTAVWNGPPPVIETTLL